MQNRDRILKHTGGLAAANIPGYITQHLMLPPLAGDLLASIALEPRTGGVNA